MNIPDKAVEAAARAVFKSRNPMYEIEDWEMPAWKQTALAALGAAAPFIRAQTLHDLADLDRVLDWDDLRAEALHAAPGWNPYEEGTS